MLGRGLAGSLRLRHLLSPQGRAGRGREGKRRIPVSGTVLEHNSRAGLCAELSTHLFSNEGSLHTLYSKLFPSFFRNKVPVRCYQP